MKLRLSRKVRHTVAQLPDAAPCNLLCHGESSIAVSFVDNLEHNTTMRCKLTYSTTVSCSSALAQH
eukprot:14180-Heterococcus_DN1.PRE.1